ncbi:MAG: hypothetical protein DRI86_08710 [Bacteroidetes bacterium]|nr:MAG: hypothetical protein DRI86_08710 [Bacteroidota bacterium]
MKNTTKNTTTDNKLTIQNTKTTEIMKTIGMITKADDQKVEDNKTNLKNWGFKQAGQLHGSIKGLINSVNVVYHNYVQETKDIKGEKYEQISDDIEAVKLSIGSVGEAISLVKEVKIVEQRDEMDRLKNEIDRIETGAEEDLFKSQFSWVGAIMSTFFAVVLGVGLYVFYTSLVYSALFKDFGAALQGATVDNFSMLFNSLFDISVFTNFGVTTIMSAILSTVFLAIAYIMHKDWEANKKGKAIVFGIIGLVMEVAFAVKLEGNINELKYMTGQVNEKLDLLGLIFNNDVLIVLILGFISYIVWSFVLGVTFKEWEKRNPKLLGQIKRKELSKKINRAKYKISEFNNELSKLTAELKSLNEKLDALKIKLEMAYFSVDELEGRLNVFYHGWLTYIKSNKHISDQVEVQTQVFEDRKSSLIGVLHKVA